MQDNGDKKADIVVFPMLFSANHAIAVSYTHLTESEIAKIKQRVIRAAQHFAKYRGTTFQDGRTENEDRTFGKRKSAMADIGTDMRCRSSV